MEVSGNQPNDFSPKNTTQTSFPSFCICFAAFGTTSPCFTSSTRNPGQCGCPGNFAQTICDSRGFIMRMPATINDPSSGSTTSSSTGAAPIGLREDFCRFDDSLLLLLLSLLFIAAPFCRFPPATLRTSVPFLDPTPPFRMATPEAVAVVVTKSVSAANKSRSECDPVKFFLSAPASILDAGGATSFPAPPNCLSNAANGGGGAMPASLVARTHAKITSLGMYPSIPPGLLFIPAQFSKVVRKYAFNAVFSLASGCFKNSGFGMRFIGCETRP
mmetsp:Transcript_4446/g.14489  ORF Transcript_4446/g.14489 Transcript_4446/m.14489 type:complete len:273 (+) Transcript_4446:798-1616(+)